MHPRTLRADMYAIIVATEKLERAYVRDKISAQDYEPACQKLIGQFKTLWGGMRQTVGLAPGATPRPPRLRRRRRAGGNSSTAHPSRWRLLPACSPASAASGPPPRPALARPTCQARSAWPSAPLQRR
jgi:hypothetical protein